METGKVTNIIIDIQYKQTIRDKERGLRVGDPQPPERPPFGRGAGRCGEVRTRAKKQRVCGSLKQQCKGVSPHT